MTFGPIDWTPLCAGVEHATATNQTVPPSDPTSNVNLLRVDLTNPQISLWTTPTALLNPNGVQTTALLNTLFDPSTMLAMFAVNANFFVYGAEPPQANQLFGLSISRGAVVNAADPNYPATLEVGEDNIAAMADGDPGVAAPWTGAAGRPYLVHEGQLAFFEVVAPAIAARTALGLSRPDANGIPRYLYLLTIDGLEIQQLQPPPYYGASYADAAQWLIAAGAWEGFNLDGGGSTTMAQIGSQASATLMNLPYGNDGPPSSERFVGSSFVVAVNKIPTR